MKPDVSIRAIYDLSWMAVGVHILENTGAPPHQVVTSMNVTTLEQGEVSPPICYLSDHNAQQLMDDLWVAGFRPQSMRYSDLTFEAQGKHLNDMRAIVATKLNVKLPEEKRNG